MRFSSPVVLVWLLALGAAQAGANAPAHRWRRTDLTPVTQPAAADGAFVFYDASGHRLQLVALDARTGKTLWKKPASVSGVTPGQGLGLEHSGSTFIALLARSGDAVISAVDARSGNVLWSSPPGRFGSAPTRCPDERTVVCSSGALVSGQPAERLRFDLATGKQLAGAVVAGPDVREVDEGLRDPGLRRPDYLVAVRGAGTAWKVPLARIFGAGSSTDYSWDFDRLVQPRLFVGSVGLTPLKITKTYEVVDLAKQVNAGFRISDGSLVWRDRGAILACGPLPCPGQPNSGRPTPSPFVGLRLRMSGPLRVTSTGTFTASRDAKVTLEGFDPATGRTRWSFAAGHSVGLITQQLQPLRTGVARILLRIPSGRYVELDLRTGARHAVARSVPAWCRAAITYRLDRVGGNRLLYVGDESLYPCDAAGARTAIPAHVPAFIERNSTTSGVVAWADTTGVQAAPVS